MRANQDIFDCRLSIVDSRAAVRVANGLQSQIANRKSTIRPAFTLLEMMVVMGIIVLLVGAIFAVGGSVIEGGRERGTKALLQLVQEAVTEFQRGGHLKKVPNYVLRYNNYPADELEVYTTKGPIVNLQGDRVPNLTPGATDSSGNVIPQGTLFGDSVGTIANQDIKTMLLTIRLYSPMGSQILDRIDARYRKTDDMADSLVRPTNTTEFLDRDGNGTFTPGDTPLEVIVDDWGQPLTYFATNVESDMVPAATPRDATSDALCNLNNGLPLLISYGKSGPDQFSNDRIASKGNLVQDLVADWTGTDGSRADTIDNPLNEDNVFIDDSFKKRLMGTES